MEHEFELTYELPDELADADRLMTLLGEAGCTDAFVGLGVAGQVRLEFIREGASAVAAILSARADLERALPGAKLIEAAPGVSKPASQRM